jgi:hypothetical protein
MRPFLPNYTILLITGIVTVALIVNPSFTDWKTVDISYVLGLCKKSDEKLIRKAIRNYNAAVSGIYATNGDATDELAVIPATRYEKRRIYKDVNNLKADGVLVAFDRDSEVVDKVEFVSRHLATAESTELWVNMLKHYPDRRSMSNLKALNVHCRYHLTSLEDGEWRVYRMEVFPQGEPRQNVTRNRALNVFH